MTEEAAGEAGAEVTTMAAPEAAGSSQEGRNYDAEAREQGWRPKEEWTGKPENWKDAKSYVEFGEIRADIKKEYEGRFSKLERVFESARKRDEARHAQELADAKAARREAAASGDVASFDKLDKQVEALEAAKPGKDDDGTDEQAVTSFKSRNAWYESDDELTSFAEGISQSLQKKYMKDHDGKQMSLAENLKLTEEKVKASALYKTKHPSANGHALVDGGSENPSASRSKVKGWSELPAEAKRAYDGFDARIKKTMTKEQYAKEYFADE